MKWRICGVGALAGFLGINLLAWTHARSMIRFDTETLERTKSPEELRFWEKVGILLSGVDLPRPQNGRDPGRIGLAFDTVRFPNQRGDELESWFIPGSNDCTVLLFHGYGASKEATLGMARVFHENGCSCLLVDFYGSGGSSGHSTSFGYHEAGDVLAAFEWMSGQQPSSEIVLYGISMGGVAVTRACSELGVAPAGLIVESAFPRLRGTVAKRFELMGIPAFPPADLLLFWGGVELGINPWRHNPIEYAAQISDPALVLAGKRDSRVPLADVEKMARNFPELVSFHVFDAGHRPFVETHCEEWEEEIVNFLQFLWKNSPK